MKNAGSDETVTCSKHLNQSVIYKCFLYDISMVL